MLRRCARRLLNNVIQCEVSNDVNRVSFRIAGGGTTSPTATVCREWILDNDVSRRHATGQKRHSLYDDPRWLTTPGGATPPITSWSVTDDHITFHFQGIWDAVAVRCSDVLTYCMGKDVVHPFQPIASSSDIQRISFGDFVSVTSVAHAKALVHLAKDGIVLVEGCSVADETVLSLARAVDCEMTTLYDKSFHVVTSPSVGPRNNIAYTAEALDLHQDIAYYESMPGLQLLHCQAFDAACTGGESTFFDICFAAQEFQKKKPIAFQALCEIPAAFMKDDWQRSVPAQYYYATPHFHVNDRGNLIKVFWSPPFEAPLPPTSRMTEYYEARRCFQAFLAEMLRSPLLLELRLKPQQTVIFHQARLLHGRRSFSEPHPRGRVLHGAYVHNDAFRNAVVTRGTRAGLDVDWCLPLFSNRSFR